MPTSITVSLKPWGTRLPLAYFASDSDRTGASSVQCCVLVVDDDRSVRRLTARMLRAEGYQTVEAESGDEALRILQADPSIQLVVTDIVMPEMHGLDLAERAMRAYPKLRVVLMTGHSQELTRQLDHRDPRLPILLKPFTAEQLWTKVRDALAGEH